jgi:hypothetical protein
MDKFVNPQSEIPCLRLDSRSVTVRMMRVGAFPTRETRDGHQTGRLIEPASFGVAAA